MNELGEGEESAIVARSGSASNSAPVSKPDFVSGSRSDLMASANEGVPLAQKIVGSVGQLLGRQLVVSLTAAVATAVLARQLTVADFGSYSAGFSAYYVLLAVVNFGFSTVLGKELGARRANDGSLTRSVIRLQILWLPIPIAIALSVAIAAGPTTSRGAVTLALVPALIAQAWSPIRQVYLANYRSRTLGLIDVVTNVSQSLLMIIAAAVGSPPVGVALVFTCGVIVNAFWVRFSARRLLDNGVAVRSDRRHIFRSALPLGVSSLLSSAYFMLDLTLIAFLTSAEQVGQYAAAVRVLSILVILPGIVMTASLSGLSSEARSSRGPAIIAARTWHWLLVLGLPLCSLVAIYSSIVVQILFGVGYEPAAEMLRILAISAGVSLLSNVFNTVLISIGRNRWILVQNMIALILNISANVALVPIFGAVASAWLTLATELVVVSIAALGLVGRWSWRPVMRVSGGSLAACTGMAIVGTVLEPVPFIGVTASAAVLVGLLTILGAWPREFTAPLLDWRKKRRS